MNITSVQYCADTMQNSGENVSLIAVIDGESVAVPINPNNRHYKAILEWEAIPGNDILDAD